MKRIILSLLVLFAKSVFSLPIHNAAATGNFEDLQIYVAMADPVNEFDAYGKTPLMYAASRGDINAVRLLCEVPEIDIDKRDNNGRTALMQLFFKGGFCDAKLRPIIDILIDGYGASINTQDKNGNNLLIHFASRGDISVVRYLLDFPGLILNTRNNDNNTAFQSAAKNRRIHVADLLETSMKRTVLWNAMDQDPQDKKNIALGIISREFHPHQDRRTALK